MALLHVFHLHSYLKLIDRGYGKFDSSQLMKRPEMMTHLMSGMVVEPQLMQSLAYDDGK